MLIEMREFSLHASHHQFYVEDPVVKGFEDDLWDGPFEDRFGETEGIVGIYTASYGIVSVQVQTHSTRPAVDLTVWDHVTETGLDIESGTLRVIGCLDEMGQDFSVEPAHYRVRCCHADLAGGVSAGEGPDSYLVQVWPAKPGDAKVLKEWQS